MLKKIAFAWEKLDEATYRAKVIGGWILLHIQHTTITDSKKRDMSQCESMVFIADRDHEWQIAKPFDPSKPDVPRITPNDFQAPASKL